MSNDEIDWEMVCAEAYQAVGCLATITGLFEHPDVVRLMDYLAYGKSEDGIPLMPWPRDPELLKLLREACFDEVPLSPDQKA